MDHILNDFSVNIPSIAFYTALTITVTAVGLRLIMINSYAYMLNHNLNLPRPIDMSRVQEGLPTEVAITPEDFMNNPELAQIFEGVDVNSSIALNLESHEHYEQVQNQIVNNDFAGLLDLIEQIEAQFEQIDQFVQINFSALLECYEILVAFINTFLN